jgi:predicted lactoylglutathione lyase
VLSFIPRFTNETATCMIVSEDIHVMLPTYVAFRQYTPKPICDATQATEVPEQTSSK